MSGKARTSDDLLLIVQLLSLIRPNLSKRDSKRVADIMLDLGEIAAKETTPQKEG
jgi:hypothetical protein